MRVSVTDLKVQVNFLSSVHVLRLRENISKRDMLGVLLNPNTAII